MCEQKLCCSKCKYWSAMFADYKWSSHAIAAQCLNEESPQEGQYTRETYVCSGFSPGPAIDTPDPDPGWIPY